MSEFVNVITKKYVFIPLLVISIIWGLFAFRWLSLLILPVLLFVYISSLRQKKSISSLVLLGLFVLFTLLPFDISFKNVAGGPKVVPYVVGLPNEQAKHQAEKGEIVVGSDVVTGFEPKWVLVW